MRWDALQWMLNGWMLDRWMIEWNSCIATTHQSPILFNRFSIINSFAFDVACLSFKASAGMALSAFEIYLLWEIPSFQPPHRSLKSAVKRCTKSIDWPRNKGCCLSENRQFNPLGVCFTWSIKQILIIGTHISSRTQHYNPTPAILKGGGCDFPKQSKFKCVNCLSAISNIPTGVSAWESNRGTHSQYTTGSQC